MPVDMTPEAPRSSSRRKLLIGLGATAAVVGGAGAAAAILNSGRTPEVQARPSPTSAASATPENTPTKTATPTKSPEPTPTKSPEAVDCKVFSKDQCDQAQRVMLDTGGVKVLNIAINLPPGTTIKAPIDGLLVKTKESGTSEVIIGQIRSSSEAGGGAAFRGDLKFENMLQQNVKAGDIIGFVNNTGVKITKDSTFNLAFTITKRTPNGPVVDEEKLKELFPKAFEKPILSATGQSITTLDYGSTPPSKP